MAEEADGVPQGIRSQMVTLSGLLSREWAYCMPPFQRPYSWTDNEVECLVEDLRVATAFDYPYYFLGHIVVHTRDGQRLVIDGQQRLATLTLLLAYLRDKTKDSELAEALQALIAPPVRAGKRELQPRLFLRPVDREFFLSYVQTPARLTALAALPEPKIKPHRLIRIAARYIASGLDELTERERDDLARFLLSKVTFNLIETDDLDSAAALFRALNYDGLRPGASTIIKSQMFEHARFSDEEGAIAAEEWDALEDNLEERGMSELWAMIEVIISGKAPSDRRNPRSFRARVIDNIDVAKFLREDLQRYLSVWRDVQRCQVDVGEASAEINRRLACMQLYRERAWVAPAVELLADHPCDPEFCKRFFLGLDRVTFACVMGAVTGRSRFNRFARVVAARGGERELFGEKGALTLTRSQTNTLIAKLNEKIGLEDNRAKIVAMRLNSALPHGEALSANDDVTLEHILPRADTEYWLKKFPNAERREEYKYLIGNFCLLTAEQNRVAANLDWDAKRSIYFKTRRAPVRAITRNLEPVKDWNETALRTRHVHLVGILCEDLELI